MSAFAGWAAAFLFTQAIEIPIYARSLRRARPGLARAIAVAFGASLITHPVVWFVMPGLADGLFRALQQHGGRALVASDLFRWIAFGALAEGFAVLVEAGYLAAFRVPRPLRLAFLANFASASLGYLSFRLTGWP